MGRSNYELVNLRLESLLFWFTGSAVVYIYIDRYKGEEEEKHSLGELFMHKRQMNGHLMSEGVAGESCESVDGYQDQSIHPTL